MTIDRPARRVAPLGCVVRVDDSMDLSRAEPRADGPCRGSSAIADVPIGVMLSGGLDSSAIVALMARHAAGPIKTYSVGFEDGSFNELPYARKVAEQFKTEQHEIIISSSRVREMLPAYLRFIDEPYADGSAIPTYYVCQLAKDDVVVVLSGEGGDEIFADTTPMRRSRHQVVPSVPRWVRHGLCAGGQRATGVGQTTPEFKLKRFLGGQDLPPNRRISGGGWCCQARRSSCIRGGARAAAAEPPGSARVFEGSPPTRCRG
jgi:hypothetical protein